MAYNTIFRPLAEYTDLFSQIGHPGFGGHIVEVKVDAGKTACIVRIPDAPVAEISPEIAALESIGLFTASEPPGTIEQEQREFAAAIAEISEESIENQEKHDSAIAEKPKRKKANNPIQTIRENPGVDFRDGDLGPIDSPEGE